MTVIARELVVLTGTLAMTAAPISALAQTDTVGTGQMSRVARPAGVSFQEQCADLAGGALERAARRVTSAPLPADEGERLVLPDGQEHGIVVALSPPDPEDRRVFCAGLRVGDGGPLRPVPVVGHAPITGDRAGQTRLLLRVPGVRFGPKLDGELLIVGYPVGPGGSLRGLAPSQAAVLPVRVSDQGFSLLAAGLAVFLSYALAVIAIGRVRGRYSLDPVYLTSDTRGKASVSQFQVLGFTLLVVGLLVYILFRADVLADISTDVLVLLGISAGGAAGAKVTTVLKERIAGDNWSWLREREWLLAVEVGGETEPRERAKWGDLLRENNRLNIYRFQLATVSAVVAVALVTGGQSQLATFEIPANLLALLGLSHGVHLGGQAVGPNSVAELDEMLVEVREAEKSLRTALAKSKPGDAGHAPGTIEALAATAPEEYHAFVAPAREAARMLKAIFGPEATKFGRGPIPEADLLPPEVMSARIRGSR